MLASRLIDYIHDFRCPNCGETPLNVGENSIDCPSCSSRYPIENGCPVILTHQSAQNHQGELESDQGKAMVNEYEETKPKASKLVDKLYTVFRPPEIMLHFNPGLTDDTTRQLFNHRGLSTRVLNVGGGPFRYSDHEITLNLAAFHNVDCVGDAHHIPFCDHSFDTVICNAVLEHVYDPEKVVEEILRVLRPGGKLYAELPFIFFFHGYPNDFHRFTLEGMKKLFSDLHNAEFGMTMGPVSAVLQSTNILLTLFIPDSFTKIRKIINGVFRWLFFPFKYLDIWSVRHPDAHKLAGGFYVLGSKKES